MIANRKTIAGGMCLWMISVMGIGFLMAADPADKAAGKILLPKTIETDSCGDHGQYSGAVLCDGVRTPIRWWEAWMSNDKATPHWVELKFATQTMVRAVAIHWNTENGLNWSSRQYKIQRWEAGGYTDVLEVKDNPPASFTPHTFAGVKTERIRIWQPAGGGPAQKTNAMSIAEIEAYDYAKSAKEFGSRQDREQLRQVQAEVRARTVGVYPRLGWICRGSAVTKALAQMGRDFVELNGLDERELKRCGILVIAGMRYIPNKDSVINFITNGGGVLFLHNACGRSGGSLLPGVWEFTGMGKSELVVQDKDHPVTMGLPGRFAHAYADHACLQAGKRGKVLLTDAAGNAVVIAGQMGEGKVIAMGNFPGLTSGPNWEAVQAKLPAGSESQLMSNSIDWLAQGTSLREEWKDSPEAKAWRKKDQSQKKQFTDVTAACGISSHGYSKGVAMADVFENGRLDIFATLDDKANLFFRNDGNWKFTEMAQAAGIGGPSGIGCVFGDVNGDGHLDLFVCWMPEMGSMGRSTLYFGDGQGHFRDVTDASGLQNAGRTAMCIMSDVDNDGHLDLYLIGYEAENKLYHNRGDGTFEEATAKFGLAGLGSSPGKNYGDIAAAMADLEGDGYQDLACVSKGVLRIFRNKAGKGFEEIVDYLGPGKPPVSGASLGLALGDIDNDGDLDIYVAWPNKLLRNDGNMHFTDITASAGFETFEKHIDPYGPIFVDYNNDGNLDLFLGTGAYDSMVYRNNGDGTFTDVTATIGLDVFGVHGCNFGDLDGDGDLDFYATAWGNHPFKLLRNNQDDQNYLKVRVKGRKTNSTGIGAKIWVYEEQGKDKRRVLKGYREVLGGGGAMYTCPPLEQHFGLPHKGRYSVEVLFPVSGKRVSLSNVSAARTITVEEPE